MPRLFSVYYGPDYLGHFGRRGDYCHTFSAKAGRIRALWTVVTRGTMPRSPVVE